MLPRYTPLPHQQGALNYLLNGGKRAVLVWHRRAGKDLTLWNYMWVAAQQRIGAYYYFYPTYAQAKKAVWYGMDEQGTRFLDYIPPELIERTHDTDMRVHFTNGSLMQLIGSDNIDSIMSTNPVGCVFSEYALQDPRAWRYVSPILVKNGGWAAFPYTPRGHNHGHTLYSNMKGRPGWYVELLTIEDTKLIDPAALDDLRATGIPEEEIRQEYYCDFSTTVVGSYFGQQMMKAEEQGRIRALLYDPRYLVHTAWDFGINDATAIWFVQTDQRTVWAIDFYENRSEGLPHYASILRQRDYVYGTHLAPHDVAKREFGTGGSIMDTAESLGISFTMVPRIAHKPDAIHAAHVLIPRTIFCVDKCERGIEGLRAYEREWDDLNKVHRNTPKHNWASHVADAYMTLACGVDFITDEYTGPEKSTGTFNPREYERYAGFDPRAVQPPPLTWSFHDPSHRESYR